MFDLVHTSGVGVWFGCAYDVCACGCEYVIMLIAGGIVVDGCVNG